MLRGSRSRDGGDREISRAFVMVVTNEVYPCYYDSSCELG